MSNETILDKLENAGVKAKTTGTDEIVCIVDRSGSMYSIKADAEGGLNAFIEEQKTVGNANLTIIEFDDVIETVCEQVNINEAEQYKLTPRNSTSLLDAIGSVISKLDKYSTDDGKTIVVVLTDGDENSSQEWTRDAIFELITERQDENGWEFIFLASGQDAIKTAGEYGFAASGAMSFANTAEGVTTGYAATSMYAASLRTMPKADALLQKKAFVDANLDTLSEVGAVEDK